MSHRDRAKMKDPFYVEPFPKAHYHPSPPRPLTHSQRKTTVASLNPEQTSWEELHISKYKSPEEVKFLSKFYSKSRLPTAKEGEGEDRDNSSRFEESWPGSERPSNISIPDSDLHLHVQSPSYDVTGRAGQQNSTLGGNTGTTLTDTTTGMTSGGQHNDKNNTGSVLSKYVERFRHGTPMSREERTQKAGAKPGDFWWLPTSSPTTPSDSSTPQGVGKTRVGTMPPGVKELTRANVEGQGGVSQHSVDAMTRYIQEKADRLLEKTMSTLSSEPAVSTDGLGSTMPGSSVSPSVCPSSVDEQAYRPAFTRLGHGKETAASAVANPWSGGKDILEQWRKQRKMEVARDRVMSVAGLTVPPGDCRTALPGECSKMLCADVDIESKLADFRNQLRQQQTMSPLKSAQLNFTPAPQRGSEQPQGAGTGLGVPPQSLVDSGSPKRPVTPPPTHPQHSHSPIASPHLQRYHYDNHDSPQPHLHLSCDILPCPSERRHLDFCQSESDSSFERLKQKHLRHLKGERHGGETHGKLHAPRDAPPEEMHAPHELPPEKLQAPGQLPAETLHAPQEVPPEKPHAPQEDPVRDTAVDNYDQKDAGRSVAGGDSLKDARRKNKNDDTRKVNSKSNTSSSESWTGPETSDRDNAHVGAQRDIQRAPEHGQDREKRKKKKGGARNAMPPPKYQSSPKQGLDGAIGQVIKERLFTSDPLTSVSLTLTSSVDSTIPMANDRDQPNTGDAQAEVEPLGQCLEDLILSEGEDFPEDDLLRTLREKRDKILGQLREIDRLLADVDQ